MKASSQGKKKGFFKSAMTRNRQNQSGFLKLPGQRRAQAMSVESMAELLSEMWVQIRRTYIRLVDSARRVTTVTARYDG